jgi:hypothetical protein
MIVADTGGILALLDQDDRHHHFRAVRLSIKTQPRLVPLDA